MSDALSIMFLLSGVVVRNNEDRSLCLVDWEVSP